MYLTCMSNTMIQNKIPIGRFSMITRLTCKALRLYDETGLLSPSAKDRFTGYRYYSLSQIERGVLIRSLVDLGFPLARINEMIDAKTSGDTEKMSQLLEDQRQRVSFEIDRLRSIDRLLERQKKEMFSMIIAEPKFKDIEPLRVLSLRDKGEYGEIITRLISRLCEFLGSPDLNASNFSVTGPFMTIYHDGEYREFDADVEVAVPVTGRLPDQIPGIEVKTIPGGRFASAIHKGPYQDVHESWGKLYEWAANQGYEPKTPCRDNYLNDPNDVPEEELLTELLIPV
ncbi:MerR family transcriptional regulator [Methanospirillum stamsii]|uniref:MerR family transcriptional regulator n=2 Tax=Methanospirillum stamsii TaxID=1277351 RepID=A0A2V2MQN8_9EURY|nr:MerR family transcriptional regulator [Methanospirillum stamsii]